MLHVYTVYCHDTAMAFTAFTYVYPKIITLFKTYENTMSVQWQRSTPVLLVTSIARSFHSIHKNYEGVLVTVAWLRRSHIQPPRATPATSNRFRLTCTHLLPVLLSRSSRAPSRSWITYSYMALPSLKYITKTRDIRECKQESLPELQVPRNCIKYALTEADWSTNTL